MNSNSSDSLRIFYYVIVSLLLATSVFLEPLISPRPDDPEHVLNHKRYIDIHKVESRLWQDPIATIERSYHEPQESLIDNDLSLNKQIENFQKQSHYKKIDEINVIAVSLPGDAYSETLEIHRRNRFAVISALSKADFYPKESEKLMFFRYELDFAKKEHSKREINVPYEWFENENRGIEGNNGKKAVLVLWLNEHKITPEQYFEFINSIFDKIYIRFEHKSIHFNLIGPSSTPLFLELLKEKPINLGTLFNDHKNIRFISPNATVSTSDIARRNCRENERELGHSKCADPVQLEICCKKVIENNLKQRSVIRSSGTDDILAKALISELQQRGIPKPNSIFNGVKKIICEKVNWFACQDRLVLIHEHDSIYSRDLSEHLKKGFNSATQREPQDSVMTFTYFRGLDGKMPDIKEERNKEQKKNEIKEISGLLAQMDDAPPEHAEGRNQYDYLRRLSDAIERLDANSKTHKVSAIGIIGNDVYDKLIILRALRERFKDKVFFTTDLDARYLHADQNKWTRNLIVASNYGLMMHEDLQSSTMPFRASYQTAAFFATLIALKNDEHVSDINQKLNQWLNPQIFEIGKTEAIHLTSPSVDCLSSDAQDKTMSCSNKATENFNKNSFDLHKSGFADLLQYESVEPSRIPLISPIKIIAINLLVLIIGMLSYYHLRQVRNATCQQTIHSTLVLIKEIPFFAGIILVAFILIIQYLMVMDNYPTSHDGEPLIWTEGISVWPNLLIRSVGIVGITMLAILTYYKMSQRIGEIKNSLKGRFSQKDEIGNFDHLWMEYTRKIDLNGKLLPCIILPAFIGLIVSGFIFTFYPLNFPLRGSITANLHDILRFFQFFAIWLLIFWVYYEINACLWLVNQLSELNNPIFSPAFLSYKEKKLGIPKSHLDRYLRFKLIVDISENINSLIYLPFIMMFVIVIGRATYFDALGLAPSLVVLFIFEVIFLWWIVHRLRHSANSFRGKILKQYEEQIAKEIWSRNPIKKEENPLNSLIENIRNTRQGIYASYANHPLLSAILLPIGGISGLHIIERFFG